MNYDSLQLSGKKVLVLGLGDTGLSCARWLAARGAQVSVADSREAPPQAARLAELLPQVTLHAGGFDDALLQASELLVVSPGVPLAEPAVARAIAAGVEVAGDVELFARAIAALNAQREHPMRVIAITGSNGKSTVTAMCGDMCRMAGLSTCVAGNIGLPVLDALYEIEQGITTLNYDPEKANAKVPVTEAFGMMGAMFAHLATPRYADLATEIQETVDTRWARLKARAENPAL